MTEQEAREIAMATLAWYELEQRRGPSVAKKKEVRDHWWGERERLLEEMRAACRRAGAGGLGPILENVVWAEEGQR